mgnify:CR=1 FL=1
MWSRAKKIGVRAAGLLTAVTVLAVLAVPATARNAYTYDYKKEAVGCPMPVTVNPSHPYAVQGLDKALSNPEDLAAYQERLYIADTGNNRIVVTDRNLQYISEITEISLEGEEPALASPGGVFVSEDGWLYVADTENQRVIVFDLELRAVRVVKNPQGSVLGDAFQFRPGKLAADGDGRLFVIAKDVYNGLMEFDRTGAFLGFTGANPVQYSLIDIFWKTILNEKQKESMERYVPTEFSGLDMDGAGFVYTVTQSVDSWNPAKSTPIRRQTGGGANILRYPEELGTPIGDLDFPYTTDPEEVKGPSAFVDIAVGDGGIYCALDSRRNRVFTYNADGRLLFVFGGEGQTEGRFVKPAAVELYDGHLYVLDSANGNIADFIWSDFGRGILEAETHYYEGRFAASGDAWKSVMRIDSRYELAYIGLGRVQMQLGDYTSALQNFSISHDKENYSKALSYLQRQNVEKYFLWIVFAVLAVVVLAFVAVRRLLPLLHRRLARYETVLGFAYAGHILIHPFDGFWDMKREKRGNLKSASIFYVLFVVTLILQDGATGFLFQPADHEFNLLLSALKGILICVLWWIASYCITTLLDGDGSRRDIVMAGGYCLAPYVLLNLPVIVLSNLVTLNETGVLAVISAASFLWCAFLLFASMTQIHQYSASKALGTLLLSLVAMAIILFLCLLLFNILQQLLSLVVSIYNEIVFRV